MGLLKFSQAEPPLTASLIAVLIYFGTESFFFEHYVATLLCSASHQSLNTRLKTNSYSKSYEI